VEERPFAVLAVQQIAVGGLDKAPMRRLWVDMLGLRPSGHSRNEAESVDEDILELGHGPLGVEVDLMQPVDPEGRPRVHQPATTSASSIPWRASGSRSAAAAC